MRKLTVGFTISLILAGCGGGGGSSTTNTASSNTNPTSSVPAKDPLRIVTGNSIDAGDAGFNPRWVIADFNKDGSKDIFIRYDPESAFSNTKTGTSPVRFFLGKSEGGFENSTSIFPQGYSPILVSKIVLSDFNGDNGPDILIATAGQDPYIDGKVAPSGHTGSYSQILTYTPNGYVLSKINNLPLQYSHHASTADFNGDFLNDVFISSVNYSEPYFIFGDSNGNYRVDTSKFPRLTFKFQKTILDHFSDLSAKKWHNTFFTATATLDANNDGHKDILAFAGNGTKTSMLFFNDGAGNFSETRSSELPVGPYGEGYEYYENNVRYTVGTIFLDAITADINNDGKLDVITLSTNSNQSSANYVFYRGAAIQILINSGNGFVDDTKNRTTFTHTGTNNFSHYDTIEYVDINKDSCKDILLHRSQVNQGDKNNNPTKILLNNCQGSFTEKSYPSSLPKGILTVIKDGHYAILVSEKNANGTYTQRIDDVYYDWSLGQNLFP